MTRSPDEMAALAEVLEIAPEVREALSSGRAVVALETSVVAHGLPPPHNLEVAWRCAAAVRAAGAVPATVALLDGKLVIGASEAQLERLADPRGSPAKAGVRDLGPLLAARRDAGTTVSATCLAAGLAGIRLFATGGIGGVHRRSRPSEPLDVSSDLVELSRRPVCVVSAGPKVILDLPATAEFLEALGVPVLGYQTGELPAFYSGQSGVLLEHQVASASEAARALRFHWALHSASGVLLAVPPPSAIPRDELEAVLAPALAEAQERGISGKQTTPFLLAALARVTEGRTVQANLALLENNARIAAEVAVALSSERNSP